MVLEQWDAWAQKRPLLTVHAKINSRRLKALNVWAKTVDLLEENRSICELRSGSGFSDVTPKAEQTNTKLGPIQV